jgi:prolyl oligopeptidase
MDVSRMRFAALRSVSVLSLSLAAPAVFAAGSAAPTGAALAYPATQRGEVVDDYFGRKVADPYRWLEELESPATAQWVTDQNAVTQRYLAQLPEREAIRKRLTALWDYQRTGVPTSEAGMLWFDQNSGLQRQAPVYRQDGLHGKPSLVIDPNQLSPDGSVAMAAWSPSPDGRWLAYTQAAGGSDVQDIYVRDLTTGKDLSAVVRHVKFSGISWTKDSRGFFYQRFRGTESAADFAAANEFHQTWYHPLETGADRLIFERPQNGKESSGASLSDNGRWLFLSSSSGTTNNRLWYMDLVDPLAPNLSATPVVIAAEEDAVHMPIGVSGDTLYLYTTAQAPKGRVVAIRLGAGSATPWRTVVPEGKDSIAEDGVVLLRDRLVVSYLVDVQSRVRLFDLSGKSRGEIALPEPGSVTGVRGRDNGDEVYLAFTSFLRPLTVYRYDLKRAALEPFYAPKPPFDASRYETRALFYRSKDGTRVPLFVTLPKGARLDGSHRTLLYGYGGFNISNVPRFSSAVAGWLELGGIYAVANLRGGGEYGEQWHRAGTRERKQNVFDDFIAAGEYLVQQRYTVPARLAIHGRSNGGLLVGATMLQRPDLFGAALPAVGVLDMMRFQRFSAGPYWVDDYGSSDDPQGAKYLLAYSPLHNLKAGTCYPATLITTADRDDRVVPSHSFKFAAALQAAQACSNPALIRIEVAGSHGYRPTDRVIAEVADQWAFLLHSLH